MSQALSRIQMRGLPFGFGGPAAGTGTGAGGGVGTGIRGATTTSTESRLVHEAERYGYTHSSGISITGRMVLNVWRIMRSEVTLNIYSFENTVYHVLHKRIPHYPYSILTTWYKDGINSRWRTLQYYLDYTKTTLDLLQHLDIVSRTRSVQHI